jgi:predicted HAD superfamily Cof-like phosphohydrolase
MTDAELTAVPKAYATPAQMVAYYYKRAGFEPSVDTSINLIDEEYQEWVHETMTFNYDAASELKELADLVYVIYGYAQACGWDLDEALYRVHCNNVGRMIHPDGEVHKDENGKIIKNPLFKKVNLEDLV